MLGRLCELPTLYCDQRGIAAVDHGDVDVDGLHPLQDQCAGPSLHGRRSLRSRRRSSSGGPVQHRHRPLDVAAAELRLQLLLVRQVEQSLCHLVPPKEHPHLATLSRLHNGASQSLPFHSMDDVHGGCPGFGEVINDNYGMARRNHPRLGRRVANARARWYDPTPVPSRRQFHADKLSTRATSGRRGERRPDVPGATDPERSATDGRHHRVQ